jgi:hypothetical protein
VGLQIKIEWPVPKPVVYSQAGTIESCKMFQEWKWHRWSKGDGECGTQQFVQDFLGSNGTLAYELSVEGLFNVMASDYTLSKGLLLWRSWNCRGTQNHRLLAFGLCSKRFILKVIYLKYYITCYITCYIIL